MKRTQQFSVEGDLEKLKIIRRGLFFILHRVGGGAVYTVMCQYASVQYVFGARTYLSSYELSSRRIMIKISVVHSMAILTCPADISIILYLWSQKN